MLMNLSEPSLLLARCGNEQYYRSAFDTKYEKSSTLLLNLQGARKRGNADCVNNNNNNVAPTPQFSPTALLNPRSLVLKRPALSGSDLNRGRTDLTIASQILLVEQLHNRIKTDKDRKKSTHRQGFNGGSSLKLQKTSSDDNNVQLVGDNIEELIYVSKVKHTYMAWTDIRRKQASEGPLGLLFSGLISMTLYKNIQLLRPVFELQRYDYYNLQDSDSLTRIQAIDPSFQTDYIYVLRSVDEIWADVADVFDTVVSKSDEVPTRELSSHIKTELYLHQKQALYFMLRDNGRKFYCLIITGEDTHYKQTIKKAYIMSLERALLILFMT
ncbi:hypothetical protein HBI69_163520 [Parastagonospora nodorum]|nr:hypothetical protein HBI69_163520 [Parastagonospora nodorum]